MPEQHDDHSQAAGAPAADAGAQAAQERLLALFDRAEDLHRRICELQREQIRVWAQLDAACTDWETYGAGDTAHYVSMLTDVAYWRAARGVAAGKALESLPMISRALEHR